MAILTAPFSPIPYPADQPLIHEPRSSRERLEAGLAQGYASPGVHNRQYVSDVDVTVQFGRLVGCQRAVIGFVHQCLHPGMIGLTEIDCQNIVGGLW